MCLVMLSSRDINRGNCGGLVLKGQDFQLLIISMRVQTLTNERALLIPSPAVGLDGSPPGEDMYQVLNTNLQTAVYA